MWGLPRRGKGRRFKQLLMPNLRSRDGKTTQGGEIAGAAKPTPWWKKPRGMILLFSLAVHVLLLMIFGGKVLFQAGKNGMVFQSEKAAPERTPEADSPNLEESAHQEMADEDAPPLAWQAPQEAVPAEAVVKISGESGWAPPVRGEGRVPVAGFSGKGVGRAKGKRELFGTVVGDKKLGVIVDVSGSMQPYLETVMNGVLTNFPDARMVLIEGCGMEEFRSDYRETNPSARPRGRKKKPRKEEFNLPIIPPHVVDFASSEGRSSPAMVGWGGLRLRNPKLYESLLQRSDTWMVVGDGSQVATRQAFEYLAGEHVQAIYWFSDFEDRVEAGEGERAAQTLQDNKIEVYLHPMDGLKNIRSWAEKVGAKVIGAKVKKAS